MRKVWSEINFTPTTFELPEDTAEAEDGEDNKDGDKPVTDARVPVVNRPEISKNTKEKLTGLKINNLPKEITEEEMVKFLKEKAKKILIV